MNGRGGWFIAVFIIFVGSFGELEANHTLQRNRWAIPEAGMVAKALKTGALPATGKCDHGDEES